MSKRKMWTVIGYWDDETPVSVGVIAGEHEVGGGMDYTGSGDWALCVEAEDDEVAEGMAVEEMRATLRDDEDEDEDNEA